MVARMNEYTPELVASFPSCGSFSHGPSGRQQGHTKAVRSEKCVGVSSQNVARNAPDRPIFWPASGLPSRLWRKANNFRGLFEFLRHYVATIILAYNEFFS